MENPFFWNHHWNNPRPKTRAFPVHQNLSDSPKIFSIPVHFMASEEKRSTAVIRIQRVFRGGFLIRKNVKTITKIKVEVERVEKKVREQETVSRIRIDEKERLKINESLMDLLFRLDSVRGIDHGVRDYRKSVTKKVILLQESVDSIAGDLNEGSGNCTDKGGKEEILEDRCGEEGRVQVGSEGNYETLAENGNCNLEEKEKTLEKLDSVQETLQQKQDFAFATLEKQDLFQQTLDQNPDSIQETLENPHSTQKNPEKHDSTLETLEKPDSIQETLEKPDSIQEKPLEMQDCSEETTLEMQDCSEETLENQETLEVQDFSEETAENQETLEMQDCSEETQEFIETQDHFEQTLEQNPNRETEFSPCEVEQGTLEHVEETLEQDRDQELKCLPCEVGQGTLETGNIEEGEGKTGNIEEGVGKEKGMIQRLVEQNERLTELVAELCERSMLQNRSMETLSQRVEQLERFVRSERCRKKKKRVAAIAVDTVDVRKCGRKL